MNFCLKFILILFNFVLVGLHNMNICYIIASVSHIIIIYYLKLFDIVFLPVRVVPENRYASVGGVQSMDNVMQHSSVDDGLVCDQSQSRGRANYGVGIVASGVRFDQNVVQHSDVEGGIEIEDDNILSSLYSLAETNVDNDIVPASREMQIGSSFPDDSSQG